jgi:hypothetical protein
LFHEGVDDSVVVLDGDDQLMASVTVVFVNAFYQAELSVVRHIRSLDQDEQADETIKR